jgi:Tfp pilus assembly protein PilF
MALLGKWFGFGRDEIFDQGMLAYDHGDWEGAIERFEACLEGGCDESMSRLARFYLAEGYAQLGNQYLRAGDAIDAVRNLTSAIEIVPHYPDLYIVLARAYAKLGDQPRRKQAIERALEINPRFVDAILELGLFEYECGDREQGLDRIRTAAEIEPLFANEGYRLGCEADAAGDHRRALAAFAGMPGDESDPGHIHLRLADNYRRERMFDEAAEEYAKALESLPAYADLHCKYGQVLLELGKIDEASQHFKEAIRQNPAYVQAHAFLGVALARERRNDLAKRELQKALDLDPHNPVALQEFRRLRTA